MGRLILNNLEEGSKYRSYGFGAFGRIPDYMPRLVNDDRRVVSPKEIMEQRLGATGDALENWLDLDVPSNIALIIKTCDSLHEIKAVIDPSIIYDLKPRSLFDHSWLVVHENVYDSHEGFVFTPSEVRALSANGQALPERRRAFWDFLTEGDAKLHSDYRSMVASVIDSTKEEIMGVWLPDASPISSFGMRLLGLDAVNALGDSCATGTKSLDYAGGYLIGVKKTQ